ncbi:AAA family ATPase [Sphingomonas sp. MMS24-JH45]
MGDWTGIPVGRMVKDEIRSVLAIGEQLKRASSDRTMRWTRSPSACRPARAKLDNPGKPVGVFMLCGPSGVGKTETAHAPCGTPLFRRRIDDRHQHERVSGAHTVSTLKGAPAGYVGYGQGGVLTEAVRRRPYSVVLLDEVEKAHADVHEMFFQVFDKGPSNDSEGRFIDFKNTLILLTSNVGTDLITQLSGGRGTPVAEADALGQALRPDLLKVFPLARPPRGAALYPLSPTMLAGIVRLQLERVRRRIADNRGIRFDYGQDVVDLIVSRCNEVASGGRIIDADLTNTMLRDVDRTARPPDVRRDDHCDRGGRGIRNSFTAYRFRGDARLPPSRQMRCASRRPATSSPDARTPARCRPGRGFARCRDGRRGGSGQEADDRIGVQRQPREAGKCKHEREAARRPAEEQQAPQFDQRGNRGRRQCHRRQPLRQVELIVAIAVRDIVRARRASASSRSSPELLVYFATCAFARPRR